LLISLVNKSSVNFTVENGKVRFGLKAVKNVGENAILAIIEARDKGVFTDLYDFCTRVDLRKVNKRVIESLIKCGAFDATKGPRSRMFAAIEKAVEMGQSAQKDRESGQFNIFDNILKDAPSKKSQYPEIKDWDDTERLAFEKESLGFYLSGHPLHRIEVDLMELSKYDTESVHEAMDGSQVTLGGMVATKKEITTRKGDRMAFVTLEDLRGSVELIVFSDVYKEKNHLIKGEDPIFVEGKVDAGEDQSKIIVTDIKTIDEAKKNRQKAVHITLKSMSVSDKKLESLKKVMKRHTGPLRSFLHIKDDKDKSTTIMLPDDFLLNPTDTFLKEVKRVFSDSRCEIR